MLPRMFDQYELRRELGRGAFGTVYLAHQATLDRDVAIKILLPDVSKEKTFVARFQREAKIAASLRHPNIVQVLNASRVGNEYYIAMEFVEGKNLREMMDEGYAPQWKEAVDLALQLLDALEHAHGKGIVHRDIKPANILIQEPDRVVLTDFSIASMKDTSRLTTTGHYLGTPEYIAPEILEDLPATPPTDLYAVGLILYELLTRVHPFRANSLPQVMKAQLFDIPVSADKLNRDIPHPISLVIDQALSKDRGKRCQSAAEMAKQLKAACKAKAPVISLGPLKPVSPRPAKSAESIPAVPRAPDPVPIPPLTLPPTAKPVHPMPRVTIAPDLTPPSAPAAAAKPHAPMPRVTISPDPIPTTAPPAAAKPPEPAPPAAPKKRRGRVGPVVLLTSMVATAVYFSLSQPPVPALSPTPLPAPSSTVLVLAEPESLELSFNGQAAVPHKNGDKLTLATGEYSVTASASGYRDQVQKLSIKPDKLARLAVKLERQEGTLVVTSQQADVTVAVDDAPAIPLSSEPLPLSPGSHKLLCSKPGYEPLPLTVEIADNKQTDQAVELKPKNARLLVNSDPPGSIVFINQVRRGYTPLPLSLPPGPVTLTLSHGGYESGSFDLTLEPDSDQQPNYTLKLIPKPKPKPKPAPVSQPPAYYAPPPVNDGPRPYTPPPRPSGGGVTGDRV